jgi:hypothetical protein
MPKSSFTAPRSLVSFGNHAVKLGEPVRATLRLLKGRARYRDNADFMTRERTLWRTAKVHRLVFVSELDLVVKARGVDHLGPMRL